MKAAGSFKLFVLIYQTTWIPILEDLRRTAPCSCFWKLLCSGILIHGTISHSTNFNTSIHNQQLLERKMQGLPS